jgi:hypothetical protein
LTDLFDKKRDRFWTEVNRVNALGTPLGSSPFVSEYLRGKGLKHLPLLRFIKDVANAGFPREAK